MARLFEEFGGLEDENSRIRFVANLGIDAIIVDPHEAILIEPEGVTGALAYRRHRADVRREQLQEQRQP